VDAYDRETRGRAPQAQVLEPGFKYNLPDMNAVLGLGQMQRLKQMNRRRAELAAAYAQRLTAVDGIEPLALPDYPMEHAWHLFVVRLLPERAGMDRDAFMAALKEQGIGTGLHFRAVHTHKYYRERFPGGGRDLPDTEWSSERICSLPLFPEMRDSDLDRVVNTIEAVLAGRAV
jgi:UDP-4-amino-4-deoxy-L-arabinose-oxoglutarate aminotransferase